MEIWTSIRDPPADYQGRPVLFYHMLTGVIADRQCHMHQLYSLIFIFVWDGAADIPR
jgi:hypothetical protein